MILDPNRPTRPHTTSRLTVEDHLIPLEREALLHRWPRRRRPVLGLIIGLTCLVLATALAYALIAIDWASNLTGNQP